MLEDWSGKGADIPARSRLLASDPIGMGTALVESLGGYLMRTASNHLTRLGWLLAQEFAPILHALSGVGWDVKGRIGTTLVANGHWVYGNGRIAEAFVVATSQLTNRVGLEALTWLNLRPLSARGLVCDAARFCPACLAGAPSGEKYVPLAWSLRVLEVCPAHGTLLLDHCPVCGRRQPPLHYSAVIGVCSWCKASLHQARPLEANADSTRWHRFVAASLAAIVGTAVPDDVTFEAPMASAIEMTTGGDQAKFGRMIGASKGSVAGWRTGSNDPRLEIILRTCYVSGLDVSSFLRGKASAVGDANEPRETWRPRPHGTSTWPQVEEMLRASLAADRPEPLRDVVRRAGRERGLVGQRYPGLTGAIRERYEAFRKVETERRFSERSLRLEREIATLRASSVPLSRRNVESEFGMILRDDRFRQIFYRLRDGATATD